MRQFLVRLLAFLVVILVIFGLYRLITVQPLKPSDFFAQATKAALVIADTGRLTQAPPYTLAALDAAKQAGADGFYLPVQLTRDGELVVLGTNDLSQFTERSEPVSQLTLAEVQSLDAGYRFDPAGDGAFPWRGKGQRVLSLLDVSDSLSGGVDRSSRWKSQASPRSPPCCRLPMAPARRRDSSRSSTSSNWRNTLRSQAPDLATANTSAEAAAFLATPDGAYPWRSKGQRVLSLQDVLAAYPDESIIVKVEEPGFASLAALLQAADATASRTRLLAIVDEQQLANTLRSQAPDLATANTSAEAAAFLATQRLRMTPFYRPAAPGLILDGDQVSRRLSNSAHSRGIRVLAVANDQSNETMRAWLDAGADGIILSDLKAIPALLSSGQP